MFEIAIPENVGIESLAEFDANFETLREELRVYLDSYKSIEVTEETLSDCKSIQKEIAGQRRKIETVRKEVKRRFTEPLSAFEKQMKILVADIDSAEESLNRGIKHFDDQRRAKKKDIAIEIIREVADEFGLNEKYRSMITLEPKYMNLTASEKAVREDVQIQCDLLLEKQKAEERDRKAIVSMIEVENRSLNAKLDAEEFLSLLRIADLDEIIERIARRAESVRLSESRTNDMEQIKESIEEPEISSVPLDDEPEEEMYKVTFVITAKASKQKKLSEFLKANGYSYEVEEQIIL